MIRNGDGGHLQIRRRRERYRQREAREIVAFALELVDAVDDVVRADRTGSVTGKPACFAEQIVVGLHEQVEVALDRIRQAHVDRPRVALPGAEHALRLAVPDLEQRTIAHVEGRIAGEIEAVRPDRHARRARAHVRDGVGHRHRLPGARRLVRHRQCGDLQIRLAIDDVERALPEVVVTRRSFVDGMRVQARGLVRVAAGVHLLLRPHEVRLVGVRDDVDVVRAVVARRHVDVHRLGVLPVRTEPR